MRERLRIKFGRLDAGARSWDTVTCIVITDPLDAPMDYNLRRDAALRMDYSDVTPPNLERRDNIPLHIAVILDEDDTRIMQSYMLWSVAYEAMTEYFTSWYYVPSTYTDRTTAAMDLGTNYTTGGASSYWYFGLDYQFNDIEFLHETFGTGMTFNLQYYNGSWTNVSGLTDNTSNFTADGNMTFTMPSDWEKTSVNGTSKYWVRVDVTGSTITPVFYFVRPTLPIVLLLERSTDGGSTWDFYNEDDYYPNIWVLEDVTVLWRPGTAQAFMTTFISLLEGY